jgi:hypothetical protein
MPSLAQLLGLTNISERKKRTRHGLQLFRFDELGNLFQRFRRCAPSEPQFESLVEAQVKIQLQELLQVWLEKEGLIVNQRTAAKAASWAIYGLALQWSYDKGKKRPSAEKFADQVLPLIAPSLRMM